MKPNFPKIIVRYLLRELPISLKWECKIKNPYQLKTSKIAIK